MTGTSARGERRVKLVHVFERDAAALHDAVERFFGDVNGQARLFLQKLIEVAQERAAPGEHEAVLGDVRAEFGRGLFERVLDGDDDLM